MARSYHIDIRHWLGYFLWIGQSLRTKMVSVTLCLVFSCCIFILRLDTGSYILCPYLCFFGDRGEICTLPTHGLLHFWQTNYSAFDGQCPLSNKPTNITKMPEYLIQEHMCFIFFNDYIRVQLHWYFSHFTMMSIKEFMNIMFHHQTLHGFICFLPPVFLGIPSKLYFTT